MKGSKMREGSAFLRVKMKDLNSFAKGISATTPRCQIIFVSVNVPSLGFLHSGDSSVMSMVPSDRFFLVIICKNRSSINSEMLMSLSQETVFCSLLLEEGRDLSVGVSTFMMSGSLSGEQNKKS